MQQNIQQHRVIVIGAGYTGASAAGRLARRLRSEDVSITLVNAEPDFVERVRMHQLAAGQDLRPRPFREMFAGTAVRLRLGRVTGIDVDRRTVSVAAPDGTGEPETLPYDTLVYALGSAWNTHAVPGAAEHAHDIAGRPGALRLRDRLASLAPGTPVVDDTMRSTSHPDVYAIGDAALVAGPGGKPLRMSCASGVPTAWQAADAIAARLTGTKLPAISARYFNQCVSLGRKEGLIQYVTADDRAVSAALTGRAAALYKELVCKAAAWGVANPTMGLPTRRRRVTAEPTRATATAA
ncbi:FAD-dependent oxidoreductase [Streptomyces sp. NPDC017524]|uniref:FAD-dependent oxidoreductase n=1 Tax=Streptomyces sp. NPDC017524 TaxID=3364999 RepID=UPI00379CD90E